MVLEQKMKLSAAPPSGRRERLRDQRGTVYVEYLIVLISIGLVVFPALAALGPNVIRNYTHTRAQLLKMSP